MLTIEFAHYLKVIFFIIFSFCTFLTFIYRSKIKPLYLKFIKSILVLFAVYLIILNINSKHFDFDVVNGVFATLIGAVAIAFFIAFLSELKEAKKKEKET